MGSQWNTRPFGFVARCRPSHTCNTLVATIHIPRPGLPGRQSGVWHQKLRLVNELLEKQRLKMFKAQTLEFFGLQVIFVYILRDAEAIPSKILEKAGESLTRTSQRFAQVGADGVYDVRADGRQVLPPAYDFFLFFFDFFLHILLQLIWGSDSLLSAGWKQPLRLRRRFINPFRQVLSKR